MKENHFNDAAKTWDADGEKSRHIAPVSEAIAARLPVSPDLTALEYGCGTGSLSFALRDRFSSITLVDSSPGMLEVARQKIAAANATNMEALLADLSGPSSPQFALYDVIYTAMALHHVSDTRAMLVRWCEMLRENGTLFVADLDKEDGTFHRSPVTVHHGFERAALETQAAEAGFVEILFRTVCSLERVCVDGVKRAFPIFLMTAKKQR